MAFIFGYSYILQTESPSYGGAGFPAREARRLATLLILGVADMFFLFSGDILTTYAVLGAITLASLHRATTRTSIGIAAACLMFTTALILSSALLSKGGGAAPIASDFHAAVALYRENAVSTLAARVREIPGRITGDIVMAPDVLAALIAGLVAGRGHVLESGGTCRRFTSKTMWACLFVGLAGSYSLAADQARRTPGKEYLVHLAIEVLTAPALTAAYTLGVLSLLRFRKLEWVMQLLSAGGRMSLTNYLGQSLFFCLMFTGYGAGLYGRVGPFGTFVAAVLIYISGLYLSQLLLRRFQHGPIEWLVRFVTFMPERGIALRQGRD
ncbi:DUF418 domain-containing protein [Streptomyces sp. NBC_01497]|uniref:DUF418 domain-containing protein n=1 Tax=Streptomyces sp. NBC_01497 TaxID=2903885 RepID=UPI002E346E39|nr:DUF418 domain-containing protein [Streptomyces sp. NBC_01497]